jgi:hypothetical protein
MTWLQGGPFLEVSILLQDISIYKLVQELQSKSYITLKQDNLELLINEFIEGYLFDDEDPHSVRIHTLRINMLVNILGSRKSILFVERVADNTILITFCFFGDEDNAEEWDQLGIRSEDLVYFIDFLAGLLNDFSGCLGGVAYEDDILSVISSEYVRPHNIFRCRDYEEEIGEFIVRARELKFIAIGWSSHSRVQIQTL